MKNELLVETLAEASHEGWMEAKKALGIETRRSEWGEELMVPYRDLTDVAKDLDRSNVKSVLAMIDQCGFKVVPK